MTVPIRVLGLGAGLRWLLQPCLGVAGNRAAAVQLGPGHPRDALPAPTGSRLGPLDPALPSAPRLHHGESTVCCEALPQLPAASPRASLERRLSSWGAGPGAGTAPRPRAPPPFGTASFPTTSPSSPLCHLWTPGPSLHQFCCQPVALQLKSL